MKKILIVLSLFFTSSCLLPKAKIPDVTLSKEVYCPSINISIEPPPKLAHIKWYRIEIDNNVFYAIPAGVSNVLILNIEQLKEYSDRCYKLIKTANTNSTK